MKSPQDIIIAHRGESFDAPENSISAFSLAWERGVKAIEMDIRITSDNEIVVIHDKNTLRVSGKKLTIRNSPLRELLRLNIAAYKGEGFKKEALPILKEVLKTVPTDCKVVIEIKCGEKILTPLEAVLADSGLKDTQIIIIAFNKHVLKKAKQKMPSYKMLLLLNLDYYSGFQKFFINKQNIIKKVKEMNLDGVDVWSGKLLDKEFISDFKKNGLLVYAWTVNNPIMGRLLFENNIDGITTDRASWMIEKLSIKSL